MKGKRIKGRIILITIGVVALFWIFESVVMVLVFQQGNLAEQMFSSDPHEIWMRSLAIGVIIAFGVYAQFTISKRKQAEQKIQQQSEFLNNVLKSLTYPLYVIDANDYTIKMANPAAKLGKLSANSACYALTHNRDKPCRGVENACPLQEVKKTRKPVVVEHIHYDEDGNARNIEVHGYPIFDSEGNVIQMIECCLDITQRKQAEHDLQERVKEMQCLYGIAEVAERPDITSDELYQEVVNLLPSSWQYPEITCARTIIDNKEFKTKNCRDTEWKQSSDIKAHGAKAGSVEVNYLEARPERDEGPFLKEERLLIDAVAKQLARITERMQAEEELRKTYQELRDTHVQLLQAGKMASMGEMAAGVAHELTQPLLGIKGFAMAMLEDAERRLPTETSAIPDIQKWKEQAVKDLEVILQQTDRMGTIVNNVRQFARESGTEMALLNINEPIEDALMLFSEQLRLHNITVKKNLSDLPQVIGNASQLQQVFINLITNARDAMDAKDDKGQLMLSTGVCPGGVYAEVEDTGIGADAETISRMFEPFFTTKTKNKSTGLGLSIVTGIIEEHGGTIDVQSEPGRGCKFIITLPPGAEEEGGENG